MEGHTNYTPYSSNENVINVKPIRTLSPMFPAPFGVNTSSVPGPRPFVCVTPIGTFPSPSGFESNHPPVFSPVFPNAEPPNPPNQKPVDPIPRTPNGTLHTGQSPNARGSRPRASLTPSFQTSPAPIIIALDEDDGSFPSTHTSASGRKVKRPLHLSNYSISGSKMMDSGGILVKRKARPKTVYDKLALMPGSLHGDPRDSVEVVLMTYDAIRRRLLQLDEVNNTNKRPDMKAAGILMSNDLRANAGKRIGPVPGVEVGDIYYLRMEMCLAGLHAPSMAGIDYMTAKFEDGEDSVAIGIVSAGGYDNEENDVDVLVYSGAGGNKYDKKPLNDQKLERGNLALERSLHRGNQIRVIRSAKDFSVLNGKFYIYDGLYKIQESWVEKAKSGFNVFKYKLMREPGQPDGIAICKMIQKWIENPLSRGRVILPDISSGVENIPVCLVNEVDDEKGPSHFTYVTTVKYLKPVRSMTRLQGCMCLSVCLPGDANCSCAQQNGGNLPFNSTGFLVSRKPLIYECNASCQCSVNCRNRVTQKGIRLHFEIFRTRDRGWGLRSWDPIRAGSFICEFTGEVVDKMEVEEDGEEDEYTFQTMPLDDKTFKWNYVPELLGEPSSNELSENFKPLPIIISAKNMGNLSRFMNHSCSPNVFWQPVQHDHGDEGYPHIMFFAIKHIPPMAELTYDYGLGEAEYGSGVGSRRAKKCLCGSPKCRGLFG